MELVSETETKASAPAKTRISTFYNSPLLIEMNSFLKNLSVIVYKGSLWYLTDYVCVFNFWDAVLFCFVFLSKKKIHLLKSTTYYVEMLENGALWGWLGHVGQEFLSGTNSL